MADEIDYTRLAELGILGGLGAYNSNRARQDANTQINDIRASQQNFGPNSPYAQQLRQQLERKDAAAGRRSQYGPREVELQARLAEVNARQQAQNAPTLNALYQQKQGARTSTGRDVASILARSGGASKISPAVRALFRRRQEDDSPEAYGADPSNTYNYSGASAEAYGADPSNTYDYTANYGEDPSNTFDYGGYDFGGNDYYGGDVDASTYDSYDFSGGDFSAGLSDADYSSVFAPGFAKGGKVDIFEALSPQYQAKLKRDQQKTEPRPVAAPPAQRPPREIPEFRAPDANGADTTGPTGTGTGSLGQSIGSAVGKGNAVASAFGEGVPGLGPMSGLIGAQNNNQAMAAWGLAGLAAVNPVAYAAVTLGKGLYGVLNSIFSAPPSSESAPSFGQASFGDDGTGGLSEGLGMGSGLGPGGFGVGLGFGGPATSEGFGIGTDGGMGASAGEAGSTEGSAFANGGPVVGPGTGTSDSIVARLSHGEYVNTAKTVDSLGTSLFDKLEAKAKKSSPAELKKFKAGLEALF